MAAEFAKCRFCPTLIPKHTGYCAPCKAAYQRRYRERTDYEKTRYMRENPKLHKNGHRFFGPGWLVPSVIPQRLATISASIVWGLCGATADVPEY